MAQIKIKQCTICDTNPGLGMGVGKLKTTCAACVGSLIAEGTCPACRGVETYTPEHLLVCDGKLPKVKHVQRRGKQAPELRTPSEILKEEAVSESLAARRARTEARKSMTTAERIEYRKKLEADAERAKHEGNNTSLAKIKKAIAAEDAMPSDRCEHCNCFLADNGKCVNDECAAA